MLVHLPYDMSTTDLSGTSHRSKCLPQRASLSSFRQSREITLAGWFTGSVADRPVSLQLVHECVAYGLVYKKESGVVQLCLVTQTAERLGVNVRDVFDLAAKDGPPYAEATSAYVVWFREQFLLEWVRNFCMSALGAHGVIVDDERDNDMA